MSAERRCARLLLHVPVRQELICQGTLELEHLEGDEDVHASSLLHETCCEITPQGTHLLGHV